MVSNDKKSSSVPFVESNQLALRPPSDSSSSTTQPNQQPTTLPRKKKESILHKFSISSRRSLSWLPGIHDSHHHHQQQQQDRQPNSISASSDASMSSIDQNNDQSTKVNHHLKKNSIGKGIRIVARTVKKSLHQLERPRSIAGYHSDRIPSNDQSDSKSQNSFQNQSRQENSHSSNTPSSHPSSPNPRVRAVSTSEVYHSTSNQSNDRSIDQPSQSRNESSPAQSLVPDRVLPSSSPQRVPKKPRPQSAIDLHSFPTTRVSNRQQYEHLSWYAQTPVGSLPMAASILAAPSPPPVDDSTFLAIIPGQKSKIVAPSLPNIPSAAAQSVEPPALTGVSMTVQPALSRRVSLTSSAGGCDSNDDNNFTFIRTPSSKPNPTDISTTTPSSPAPDGLSSSIWTEIAGQSTTLESLKSRPPLVSVSTTISLVQSCIAERGSITEFDEITEREHSTGYQVDDAKEDSTSTVVINPEKLSESSGVLDCLKIDSKKRKVTNINSAEPDAEKHKLNQNEFDSSEEIIPQRKVLRSMDQPFSSSKTWTAMGMNHSTSHPLSLLTVNQISTTTTTTNHLIHRLESKTAISNTSSYPVKNQSNFKNRSDSTRSKNGSKRNFSSISNSRNHDRPDDNRNAHEIWNLTIVSTVVGVVIIAAVLIGSTNFSTLNGKSWIGKLVKRS